MKPFPSQPWNRGQARMLSHWAHQTPDEAEEHSSQDWLDASKSDRWHTHTHTHIRVRTFLDLYRAWRCTYCKYRTVWKADLNSELSSRHFYKTRHLQKHTIEPYKSKSNSMLSIFCRDWRVIWTSLSSFIFLQHLMSERAGQGNTMTNTEEELVLWPWGRDTSLLFSFRGNGEAEWNAQCLYNGCVCVTRDKFLPSLWEDFFFALFRADLIRELKNCFKKIFFAPLSNSNIL